MAYDARLAARVRALLRDRRDVEEVPMFGGIKFMVDGAMACGIVGEELVARVGPDRYDGLEGYNPLSLSRRARGASPVGRPRQGKRTTTLSM